MMMTIVMMEPLFINRYECNGVVWYLFQSPFRLLVSNDDIDVDDMMMTM